MEPTGKRISKRDANELGEWAFHEMREVIARKIMETVNLPWKNEDGEDGFGCSPIIHKQVMRALLRQLIKDDSLWSD